MNMKLILIVVGIAVLVASLIIDARYAPIVGAALLLGAIIYGWAANRSAGRDNLRQAEEATHRQREERAHDEA